MAGRLKGCTVLLLIITYSQERCAVLQGHAVQSSEHQATRVHSWVHSAFAHKHTEAERMHSASQALHCITGTSGRLKGCAAPMNTIAGRVKGYTVRREHYTALQCFTGRLKGAQRP
ncbi:hypothetical protein DUNSADRAFT_11653 [Dunaliella salina]|uniref:Secreted protein n=1 Tax=Dunaliella salina TaxID=3046 RepID=A0ABQ7GCZ7_DUNSA|nr:hypothetical protein DUNSADRAFT_11653 [Dunaliella salina]|eukprot:KAF5832453.1 hypothetical protein DUNSADRAFT_11653 [Dunaliella salina]